MTEVTYSTKAILGVTGMLTFGTGTMVSSKIMLDMSSVNSAGQTVKFEKPVFQTFIMFTSMAIPIIVHLIGLCMKQKKIRERRAAGTVDNQEAEKAGLLGNEEVEVETAEQLLEKEEAILHPFSDGRWKSYVYVAFPSIFDMIATTLMTDGLEKIDVSIMQMLRGSMVIFSAIFSHFLLHKRQYLYNWMGVIVAGIACALVGVSSIMTSVSGSAGGAADTIEGCTLVVCSQLVQAGQIVTESYLLSGFESTDPLQVVGMEGVFGTLITGLVLYPLAYILPGNDPKHGQPDGCMENFGDVFTMMANNHDIIWCALVYWICILFLNVSGMTVTNELNAVHRTVWESIRTVAIWITDLFIGYVVVPNSVFGEFWTYWSFLQLAGFVWLSYSSFLYSGNVKYPFLSKSYTKSQRVADGYDQMVPITCCCCSAQDDEEAAESSV
ncbi:hypothetical protein ADUPG1_009219 [Aduncisulcus paluster]|uniref:EamA domain-containing protein n=1 Tax=Aduncisulcus paluster TaxID=2918883 RepID=A0ABQ5KW11_9EUKA|nr:hypothetical protein ADUPG1_009219 [Aduncisulcus paluster]|eukprot:gnl/Carplike_NY0171/509_a697_3083.p1 GENE.gnl/Carplike_NY0171/509_a697_3083~~gnl/Carplike_NY0171/509_a697_3083.p1  ORF type:complete len:439 (-),score=135.23 gnl/Carplike_NY0171/509_a697_3083:118-1434(-)